uniref:Uncharacterized protein n=1 Tax=Nelumbo nucifera TaxID=4432 RepID=A0A822Z369_NELNU|nr:TPA_asm: hypothetical protein HUJ06_015177 [Nelumbo nucifera]
MKSLENTLDAMKSMKSRHVTVNVNAIFEALQRTAQEKEKNLEEEDESLIKSIVFPRFLFEEFMMRMKMRMMTTISICFQLILVHKMI